jgi:hypothetical protein
MIDDRGISARPADIIGSQDVGWDGLDPRRPWSSGPAADDAHALASARKLADDGMPCTTCRTKNNVVTACLRHGLTLPRTPESGR